MKYVALCALLLLGCESTSERLGHRGTYFQDERTGLCFVHWREWVLMSGAKGASSGAVSITSNVPCTPAVIGLIQLEATKGE